MPDKTPMVVFFNNVFFFQEREKDLLKISFKRERKGLSVIGHVNGPIARDFNNVFFFQEREKDLLKYKEPSSRQCLSQEREKTCYLRWLSEVDLRSVGIETIQ